MAKNIRVMTILLVFLMTVSGSLLVPAAAQDETEEPTSTVPNVGRGASGQQVATVTPVAVRNEDGSCMFDWFFSNIDIEACPTGETITSSAAFQRFEYGYMIWTEFNDQIHVMYHTVGEPQWLMAPDPYVEGTPEHDVNWPETPPPQTNQPRLGFGKLWEENDELRHRIGWAAQTWEIVYDARTQVDENGTIYLEEPGGGIFVLPPNEDWQLYIGS